ncbi:MAG TPA: lanthionine synthetase LanC family protein [Acidobacteriota bacterium]|nr:lanthionine synthetase LanC family protein [Acidobacteriota bacterium]
MARHSRPSTISRSVLSVIAIILTVMASCKRAPKSPYLEASLEAASWVRSAGMRTPEGLSWPSIPPDQKTVGLDLYSGVPGVVLFLVQAFYATGDRSYLKEACSGADLLMAKAASVAGAGLYEGLSGIALALEETYKASKDERYRRGSLDLLERIASSAKAAGGGVEWSATTDIISGSAGTGLFLIYAFHETGDRTWLDLAARAGTRLVELGRPENGGLKWAMDPGFPRLMPNFSHGTAGIAYFLAALSQETGRKEFLDAALAGAKYLLSVAKTDSESCLVFHDEPDNKDLYYLGWCHGPVGTARLFFLLSRATSDKTWLDWVRKSANGLLGSGIPEKETPGFWNNAGICCGLAGVGEFFLDLYRELGDPAYLDFSKRVASRLLAKATVENGRMFWVQAEHRTRPDYVFAQTGYMQGAAGIGAFLLRLAAFDRAHPRRIAFPDTPFVR